MTEQQKKRGLFDGLLDLVAPDDGTGEKPDTKPAEPARTSSPPAAAARPVPAPMTGYKPSPAAQAAGADPSIYATLKKALVGAALPAFDAFEKVFANFANIPGMTEQMKVQAAMQAVVAMGQQPAQVITDINECLDALAKKEREGQEAAARALQSCESETAQTVQELDARLTSLAVQKAEVERQLSEAQAARAQVSGKVEAEKAAISSTQQRFGATVAQIRSELTSMREKLTAQAG